jgi:hypothetical protein
MLDSDADKPLPRGAFVASAVIVAGTLIRLALSVASRRSKMPPDLPLFVRQTLWVNMREWEDQKTDSFYRLVCGIVGRPPGDSPLRRFGPRDVFDWQQMRV